MLRTPVFPSTSVESSGSLPDPWLILLLLSLMSTPWVMILLLLLMQATSAELSSVVGDALNPPPSGPTNTVAL